MKALELSQKYTTLLRSYGVNTAKRKAMFFVTDWIRQNTTNNPENNKINK